MTRLDPKRFGLHSKTELHQTAKNQITIVISRKSRVIMADAKKIIATSETIRQKAPEVSISVKFTGPVCSKSVAFLQESGISILK